MKTSAKDLRLHTKRVLDAVERGEEVTITHRGKPRAKIVPVRSTTTQRRKLAHQLPLFGIWKNYADVKDVPAYINKLRSGRH